MSTPYSLRRVQPVILLTLVLAVLAGLAACGSDGPQAQTPVTPPQLTGTATYDATVVPRGVSVKGTAGLMRTNSNSSGTNQFAVDLQDLTGPYALHWIGGDASDNQVNLYGLAIQPGVANVTPLTTLLVAQLLGQPPAAAFAAFSGTSGNANLVTDTNLQAAQAKVTAYLENTLGVAVKSGSSSYITSPFKSSVGDPMFDTIVALDAQLVAKGTTLDAVAATIAAAARLCIVEKIEVTLSAGAVDFCTASKSATPEANDSTILDYNFTDPAQDSLTLNIQGDSVLGAQYVTPDGATYTCSAGACNAIALGTVQEDLTRTITFTGTQLNGTGGSVVLNGSVLGPIPGVALPVLPCNDNRYFVIFPDRSVVAECIDTNDPFGLGGVIDYNTRGEFPSRAIFDLVSSSDPDPLPPILELVTDANNSVISVEFYKNDPSTGNQSDIFYCQLSDCNGITLGPVTTNTDLGPDQPVYLRNVTLNNTILAGANPDGTPTNTTATVKASFTMIYYVDPYNPSLFPPLADCPSGDATVSVAEDSGSFNFCSSPANQFANSDGATTTVGLIDDSYYSPITATFAGGVVKSVIFNSTVQQYFGCTTDCTGVTLSTDDSGNVSLAFAGTVLHELQQTPLPPGPRTVTLSSSPIVIPVMSQSGGVPAVVQSTQRYRSRVR